MPKWYRWRQMRKDNGKRSGGKNNTCQIRTRQGISLATPAEFPRAGGCAFLAYGIMGSPFQRL